MEKFIPFIPPLDANDKPQRFTFPFYYEPHPWSIIASLQLQEYLSENEVKLRHNFGLSKYQQGLVIGKMFGVLVVEKEDGELGFLAAYSGKLADSNQHEYFVPPVFDLLKTEGFFKKEEAEINEINRAIESMKKCQNLQKLTALRVTVLEKQQIELSQLKSEIKSAKTQRNIEREKLKEIQSEEEQFVKLELLRQASIREQYHLKDIQRAHKMKVVDLSNEINQITNQITFLKERRKQLSSDLQDKIFDSYSFFNQSLERKSLRAIFSNTIEHKPPAGAGECAAPKLLHYAFENKLKPICMAEFWWGASPKSEVRIHQQYYPACRGKCEPILSHMLSNIELDDNPMLQNSAAEKTLEIIFEDEYLLVVNKPTELLSVPGKNVSDSVYQRVRQMYPNATGPLIVHRLDMSTSGILLLAKDIDTYKKLQVQFVKRKVEKRYVALLDGIVKGDSGEISLPLRVDLDDRPRQLVCYEHGKSAHTKWQVVSRNNNQTLVYFYPLTGRTHQLRVHAAHPLGLGIPIVGDDLYGNKSKRLCLHAEQLIFTHPITKKRIEIQIDVKKISDNF